MRTGQQPKLLGISVILRVRATGVCHTDLHIHEGGYDLCGGRRLSFKERGIKLPDLRRSRSWKLQ